jgi:sulfopyruvate decarboxylase subunit alpha
MEIDILLYKAIKNSGIDLILSVPCDMLKGLINEIENAKEISYVPVTREEEGVGIAAGAYLGGYKPLILMQNSGLGNSINAIKSLLELYEIPVIFMMSHRGTEGEKISAQIPMGKVLLDLLDCIGIESLIINSHTKIINIEKAVKKSKETSKPIALILERALWERES